ncbi:MAG: biotin--[acetyl-CoA-carboxylase] ligase [Deltaproteobacteria bacterium]|nr:biotin--[acetyl-CoA-carboxylase] ligase [Deltaproteobacteria bacterium]
MHRPNLVMVESTESTQDMAGKMAAEGFPSGAAVMALRQTRGRGRSGSEWISPPGKNLSLSVILRPVIEIRHAPLIGMLASIAVATVVDLACEPYQAFLKWPNDVLIQNRKIAGILSEARITDSSLEFIVLGVGINVNSSVDDFPVEMSDSLTSMSIITGRTFDLRITAERFLEALGELIARVETEGPSFVPSVWEKRWAHKGHSLIRDGIKGTATGIDSDGALLMKLPGGEIVRISSGAILAT